MDSTWDALGIPASNFSPSATPIESVSFPLYLRIYVTTICVFIFLIGILGNALVPVLMWKTKELRNSTNVFLLNLSLADTLVLLICLPTSLVELHTVPNTWILGAALCHLVPFVEVCVTRASIITLAVISVERYFAICCPLRSTSFCSRPKAFAVCLLIWPVSLLAAGPMFFITEYGEIDYGSGGKFSFCFTPITGIMKHYFIGSAAIFFLIPLFFLSVIYFFITRQLLNQKAWMRRRADRAQWHARKQVSLMFAVVIAVFFICLIPFNAFTLWIIIVPSHLYTHLQPKIYYNILFAFRILIYVNSAANPLIYNVMSAKFRFAFRKLFQRQLFDTYTPRRRSTLTTTLSSTSSTSSRSNSLKEITSHLFPRRLSEAARRTNEKIIGNSIVNNSSRTVSKYDPTEVNLKVAGKIDVIVGRIDKSDFPSSRKNRPWNRKGSLGSSKRIANDNRNQMDTSCKSDGHTLSSAYVVDTLPSCRFGNGLKTKSSDVGHLELSRAMVTSPMKKVSFRERVSLPCLDVKDIENVDYSCQDPIYDNWPPKLPSNNTNCYI